MLSIYEALQLFFGSTFQKSFGIVIFKHDVVSPRNVVVNVIRCMLKCGAKCMDENCQQILNKRKS
jgi:hypothetical protein